MPQDTKPANEKHQRKLDLAARAAWLYYIANNTQDEISDKLRVSRQAAQRLVSLAVAEKLIKFRIDHPIAACADLAEKLRQKFALRYCEVVPAAGAEADMFSLLGVSAADYLETLLTEKKPMVLAFGTGRTMRAMVGQIPSMHEPQHTLVSVVGNMTHDGRASHFEVVMQLADRIGAQAFLLQTPVVTQTVAEKKYLQSLKAFKNVRALAAKATHTFVGVSDIGPHCPMCQDGFLSIAEVKELDRRKAVGEVIGWAFDKDGNVLNAPTNQRVGSVRLDDLSHAETIGAAGGARKVKPLLGAMRGRLITGLVTDETTAAALLKS